MRLVSFVESGVDSGHLRIGVLDAERGEVVDLTQAAPGLPGTMPELIAMGETGLERVRAAVAASSHRLPLDRLRLLAPIPRPPRNIFCAGKNYRAHLKEVLSVGIPSGSDASADPEVPIFFTKAPSAVTAPFAPIPAGLDPTHSVDYEGELAVVIGPGGRGIVREEAMGHVYGYTIVNDVSSRHLQRLHQQWFLGKSIDGFCPMGPVLLTSDEIGVLADLCVRTRVNGELRQDGCVADMIFDIPTLIETLSRTMTLEPGDIIATGTPAGVGMGFTPPRYLQRGDRVAITIEPIGTLENPVE